jgi:hypothetical protein
MRAHRSRAWSCAMNFAIQFLDGSRTVVSEWRNLARDTARAIEATQERWPAGASRLEILDENGLAVHWRIEPNEPSASQEGVASSVPGFEAIRQKCESLKSSSCNNFVILSEIS